MSDVNKLLRVLVSFFIVGVLFFTTNSQVLAQSAPTCYFQSRWGGWNGDFGNPLNYVGFTVYYPFTGTESVEIVNTNPAYNLIYWDGNDGNHSFENANNNLFTQTTTNDLITTGQSEWSLPQDDFFIATDIPWTNIPNLPSIPFDSYFAAGDFNSTQIKVNGDLCVVGTPPVQIPQLSALSPAQIWVGLKNSDDVGIKFDLLAEAYVNGILVSSGELDSVAGGSSGFNRARLQTIPFNSFSPVDFPTGSTLSMKLYVRNACTGSTHNSGTARLWYNDSVADSQFGTTIDSNTNPYYLLSDFYLGVFPGSGPRQYVDVAAGSKCSPFKPFGTWVITP